MYLGDLQEDQLEKYNCLLCFGTVFKPLKCDKCSYLYCARCIPDQCKETGKFKCFRKCGSETKNCIKPSVEELTTLKNMTFACQNDECEEFIKYGNYFKHMTKECKIKTYKAATMPEGAFNN